MEVEVTLCSTSVSDGSCSHAPEISLLKIMRLTVRLADPFSISNVCEKERALLLAVSMGRQDRAERECDTGRIGYVTSQRWERFMES